MNWRELLGLDPRMEDFAAKLQRELRKIRPNEEWTFDRDERVMRSSLGSTVNLVNIFMEYAAASRAARKNLFDKYISIFIVQEQEVPRLWVLAAKAIYPAIRSRFDSVSMEIEDRGVGKLHKTVRWPLVDDLSIRLMYDFGPSMAHVTLERLETWGVTDDVVRAQALSNLRSLERPSWVELRTGVFRLQSGVAYEETFFLLDEVMKQLAFAEHAVVMPINRGVLLAADSRRVDDILAMLHEAFGSLQENPWPISGAMLTRNAVGWQKFTLPRQAEDMARAVEKLNLAGVYADQKEALQAYCDKVGDDVFVATFELRTRSEQLETLISWSSWAEGVATLLPKSDIVIMGRGKDIATQERVIVAWDRMMQTCGRYLLPTEEDPPRFRVAEFPSEEEWTRIKAGGDQL